MKDSIIAGTGNSRYLRTSLPADTTWEDALEMLRSGTFPVDFAGINDAGFTQLGTALNTANLLKSAVVTQLGLDSDATPSDAWLAIIDRLRGMVSSVAGKTGSVSLGAGDVSYSSQESYANGTAGAAIGGLAEDIGDLSSLETDDKTSLVSALNEVAEGAMPDVDYGTSVLLVSPTEVAFSKDGNHNWYISGDDPVSITFGDDSYDSIFRVTWDGVVYELPYVRYARMTYYSGDTGILAYRNGLPRGVKTWGAIGNVTPLGYATRLETDAPFAICDKYTDSTDQSVTYTHVRIVAYDTAASHTIKIEKIPIEKAVVDPQLYLRTDYGVPSQWSGSGVLSVAEADATDAVGQFSHAEGRATLASGNMAHAEGSYNVASGKSSHAEGASNIASGSESHAEGQMNRASGIAAHAEGTSNEARGTSSHVEGSRSIATHRDQHIFGKFNALDPSEAASTERGTYVEMVGNGTAEDLRNNARTLDWQGNERLAGSLTLGAGTENETTLTAEDLAGLLTWWRNQNGNL